MQRQPRHRRVQVHTDSVVAVVEVVETRAASHPKVEMVVTVLSSFALQAWTTTIGRSPHGSMLPVFKAAPSSVHTMTTGRPRISDGRSGFEQPTATSIQRWVHPRTHLQHGPQTPPSTPTAGITWSWWPMLATRFDSTSMASTSPTVACRVVETSAM